MPLRSGRWLRSCPSRFLRCVLDHHRRIRCGPTAPHRRSRCRAASVHPSWALMLITRVLVGARAAGPWPLQIANTPARLHPWIPSGDGMASGWSGGDRLDLVVERFLLHPPLRACMAVSFNWLNARGRCSACRRARGRFPSRIGQPRSFSSTRFCWVASSCQQSSMPCVDPA